MQKHQARQITYEESQYLFIRHIISLANYWENEERRPTSKEKLEGMAFTVLSFLDGSNADMPGFYLVPNTDPTDVPHAKEEGYDYFEPLSDEEREIIERVDIGGGLHDKFHAVLRGEIKKPEGLRTFGDLLVEDAKKWTPEVFEKTQTTNNYIGRMFFSQDATRLSNKLGQLDKLLEEVAQYTAELSGEISKELGLDSSMLHKAKAQIETVHRKLWEAAFKNEQRLQDKALDKSE